MEKDLTQKGQFLRCLIRLGGVGGLTPNETFETLSHSNGKFVFDHGPKVKSERELSMRFLDPTIILHLV